MEDNNALYASRIFLNAALPLVKVLAEEKPALRKAFAGRNGIVQVSARNSLAGPPRPAGSGAQAPGGVTPGGVTPGGVTPGGVTPRGVTPRGVTPRGVAAKVGTHFVVEDGSLKVVPGLAEKADVELAFPSVEALNGFFSGKSKKLPRISGALANPGLFLAFLKSLLAMAGALGATDAPDSEEEKALLVKLYFYLLTAGISQLNKAEHPAVSKWAAASPDRVYALAVTGDEKLAAYVRVKAGNTKAVRGVYARSKPFFTLAFDSVDSALGTLLGKDEMLAATAAGRIQMLGAPEYGATLGEFLLLVGSLAK